MCTGVELCFVPIPDDLAFLRLLICIVIWILVCLERLPLLRLTNTICDLKVTHFFLLEYIYNLVTYNSLDCQRIIIFGVMAASSPVVEDIAQSWIRNVPEMIYDAASQTIHCSKCETSIKSKKSNLDRHLKSQKHRNIQSTLEDFYMDLVNFLIMGNIPWSQVENPTFIYFFQKYICSCKLKRTIPSESTLRKYYLDRVFQDKMKIIHSNLNNCKWWISLDETTDFLGRNVVHFLVKPLIEGERTQTRMLACKVLGSVTGQSIAEFVTECLRSLWGDDFKFKVQNVLIMVTDSVSYMLLAGKKLKKTFPNLIHFTCLAHALHRLTEKIRADYEDVDILISNVKKVFLKSPNRLKILKDMYPNLPLPPQPIITRWGTWLEAAFYYAKYFEQIQNVISKLNPNEAISIRNVQNVLLKSNLLHDLKFIDEYFNIIQMSIKKLEKQDLSISQLLEIFDQVRIVMEWTPNNNEILEKLENLMDRNPGFDLVREISQNSTEVSDANLYKFAPLTSVDVERSFSSYKWILNLRRNRLKIENMEKIMILYFNSKNILSQSAESSSDVNVGASCSQQSDEKIDC